MSDRVERVAKAIAGNGLEGSWADHLIAARAAIDEMERVKEAQAEAIYQEAVRAFRAKVNPFART